MVVSASVGILRTRTLHINSLRLSVVVQTKACLRLPKPPHPFRVRYQDRRPRTCTSLLPTPSRVGLPSQNPSRPACPSGSSALHTHILSQDHLMMVQTLLLSPINVTEDMQTVPGTDSVPLRYVTRQEHEPVLTLPGIGV